MATVRIPPPLRSDAGGQRLIELPADDVADALERLIGMFPTLAGRLLEGGALPAFLNVFVDGQDIRTLKGLSTPLKSDSKVLILPAMAGGSC